MIYPTVNHFLVKKCQLVVKWDDDWFLNVVVRDNLFIRSSSISKLLYYRTIFGLVNHTLKLKGWVKKTVAARNQSPLISKKVYRIDCE